MKSPAWLNVLLLLVLSTAFYTYVGQIVPQKEQHPPEVIEIPAESTTEDLIALGEEIANGKGLCLTCHTIGQSGALRFPDLAGIGSSAASRIDGLDAVEYLAQSLYEPDVFIVEGFLSGMPAIDRPPIGLTDEEILCVIAWLQSLGGEATVTLQTSHAYYDGGSGEG